MHLATGHSVCLVIVNCNLNYSIALLLQCEESRAFGTNYCYACTCTSTFLTSLCNVIEIVVEVSLRINFMYHQLLIPLLLWMFSRDVAICSHKIPIRFDSIFKFEIKYCFVQKLLHCLGGL